MNEVVELLDGCICTEWVRPNQKKRSKLGRMESWRTESWGPASAWLRRSEYPETATAQKALFMAAHGTPAYMASFLVAA